MAVHEIAVKQRLNLPVSRPNFLLVPYSVFKRGLNTVMEKQRLNNRYSWLKHGLVGDFHKRCLKFVYGLQKIRGFLQTIASLFYSLTYVRLCQ